MHWAKLIPLSLSLVLILSVSCSDDDPTSSPYSFRVLEVKPAKAARQVALDSQIDIKFNQNIDSSSVDGGTITMNDSLAGTLSIGDSSLTFVPTESLDSNTSYQVVVSKNVSDIDGNTLADDYSWSFTTVDGAGSYWIESKDSADFAMFDVAWGNGLFIMVGGTGGIPSVSRIYSSDDGNEWTLRSEGENQMLFGVGHFKDRFLAVGESGTILRSETGETWQNVSSGTTMSLFDIASSPNTCIAVGTGFVLVSNDGLSWKRHDVPFTGQLTSTCWTGDKFIATTEGDSLSYFLISDDGKQWNSVSLVRGEPSRKEFYSVTASPDLIVAVGPDENLFTSINGTIWTERDLGIPSGEWVFLRAVIWDGQRFVAVGGSHAARGGFTTISRDGIHWEQQLYVDHNGAEFTSIAWSGMTYVLSSYRMNGRIFYSP